MNRRRKQRDFRRLKGESLEPRCLLAAVVEGDFFESVDVNRDGHVSPQDALMIINHLNAPAGLPSADFVFDVDGNGENSPMDALWVINRLNETTTDTIDQVHMTRSTVAAHQHGIIAGDYDFDCLVDQDDYELWSSTFGSTTNLAADGNGNGIIDAADYTVWRDNLGSSLCSSTAIWTLTNREFTTRDLHAAADGNADLALVGESGTQWEVTDTGAGVALRNVDSGEYLTSDNWETFTTPTAGANTLFQVVANADGSISLQNIATGRYVDGDGLNENWNVDESIDILFDDGWFVTDLTETGDGVVTGIVFSDHDSNAIRYQGGGVAELGLAGRSVYVDLNENGSLDIGEPFAITDAEGVYLIDNAPLGTHDVRLVAVSDWTGTTDTTVEINVGSNPSTVDFGQYSASQPFLSVEGTFRLENRATSRYMFWYGRAHQPGPPDSCVDIAVEGYGTHPTSFFDNGNLPSDCQWSGTAWSFVTDEIGTKIVGDDLDGYGVLYALGSQLGGGVRVFGRLHPASFLLPDQQRYWGLSLNSDGSVSLQSTLHDEYLSAEDTPTFELTSSSQLGSNEGWFLIEVE